MKKLIYVGLFSLTLLALFNANSVNGQEIRDGLDEDQVIVCVNGNVVELELNGDLCKVFMADFDHPRTIQDIQQELYLNPNDDTFEMWVID